MATWPTPRRLHAALFLATALTLVLCPASALADVEGSLVNIKNELTSVILPVLSVIGLGIASVSFFTGNPNAKQHITYAILGSCIGFGAQQIVNFIGSLVH